MPKLLTQKEMISIAKRMTDEYALPPIRIKEGYDHGLMIEIYRIIKMPLFGWFQWLVIPESVKLTEFYATDFEQILLKLEIALSTLQENITVAERFRDKYDKQEADEALDNVLRKK